MKNQFFFFDEMITPKIINIIYWLLLIGCLFYGLNVIFFGGFSIGKFFTGVLSMLGGALAARIWCELLIVTFKINDNLKKLNEK